MADDHLIITHDALLSHYGEVNPNSIAKETSVLTPTYRAWIQSAPFVVIASAGPGGLDCSPRGDEAGHLIDILDDRAIAIPDRRGNNRIDTLKNIVDDPRVALLFLIPGINETVRINGRARITTEPELLGRFEISGTLPATVIVVNIEAIYFQCARAFMRSGMWDVERHLKRGDVPTAGQMTKSALGEFDAETYDGALLQRQKDSLY